MGLSSSQARLLSITSRVHSLELKAQRLQAAKLRLANDSDKAYSEYLDGLEAKKLQFKTIDGNGSISFVDATYNILKAHGYEIKLDSEDKEVVTAETAANFEAAKADGGRDYFAALETGRVSLTSNVYDDGSGVGPVHEIYTVAQFMSSITSPGGCNKLVLMSNLDMTGKGYTAQSLNGLNIDGNGHSITGLTTSLFSSVYNSNVSNLRIDNGATTVNDNGLFARTISGTTNISNVSVKGNLGSTTSYNQGGFAGVIQGASVNIEKCSVNVIINNTSTYGNVGGFAGTVKDSAHISDCSVSGSVKSDRDGGGFVAMLYDGATCDKCKTTASVYTTDKTWGNAGGFSSHIYNGAVVTNSSASGDVSTEGIFAAGFAFAIFSDASSAATVVTDCDASGSVKTNCNGQAVGTGSVHSSTAAAGFVECSSKAIITNCNAYSTSINAPVSSTLPSTYASDVAGFVVHAQSGTVPLSEINNCYAATSPFNYAPASNFNIVSTSSTPISHTTTPIAPSHSTPRTLSGPGVSDKQAQFDRLLANGYTTMTGADPRITFGDNPKWLENMLEAGMLIILKPDENGNLIETSAANDTNLQQVADETDVKRLEAKYEADMRAINRKDQEYDTKLSVCETERSALTNEMETLKSVAKDNVSMSFKLFG